MPVQNIHNPLNSMSWNETVNLANKKEFRGPVTELVNKLKRMVGFTPELSNRFQSIKESAVNTLKQYHEQKFLAMDYQDKILCHYHASEPFNNVLSTLKKNLSLASNRTEVRAALQEANEKFVELHRDIENGIKPGFGAIGKNVKFGDFMPRNNDLGSGENKGKVKFGSVKPRTGNRVNGQPEQRPRVTENSSAGNGSYTSSLMAQLNSVLINGHQNRKSEQPDPVRLPLSEWGKATPTPEDNKYIQSLL